MAARYIIIPAVVIIVTVMYAFMTGIETIHPDIGNVPNWFVWGWYASAGDRRSLDVHDRNYHIVADYAQNKGIHVTRQTNIFEF